MRDVQNKNFALKMLPDICIYLERTKHKYLAFFLLHNRIMFILSSLVIKAFDPVAVFN